MVQLPNFPHPPMYPAQGTYDEEDIISNPSMENMRARYVEAHDGGRPMTASSGASLSCSSFWLWDVGWKGCGLGVWDWVLGSAAKSDGDGANERKDGRDLSS